MNTTSLSVLYNKLSKRVKITPEFDSSKHNLEEVLNKLLDGHTLSTEKIQDLLGIPENDFNYLVRKFIN